jgi:cyclophilin family peptidyl-prolyl cis-trans isomerase
MSNTNKILAVAVLVVIGVGAYFWMQSQKTEAPQNQNTNQNTNTSMTPPPPPPAPVPDKAVALFETSEGNFEVTLDGKAAPKTVANFIKLANEGYYNGTKFHRIVADFMIQGGDPNSKNDDVEDDGQGGPGYTVPAEISLTHKTGAIATARIGGQANPTKASSGSQFFIVLAENVNTRSLNGDYTVFGYVTTGMSVVTKIGQTPTEPNPFMGGEPSIPLKDVVVTKITIKE